MLARFGVNVIVLLGYYDDKVIAAMARYFLSNDYPYIFIPQESIGKYVRVDPEYMVWENGFKLKINEVWGIFNRYLLGDMATTQADHKLLVYLLDYVWPNVVNRFVSGVSNWSKLYQLSILRDLKDVCLKIPESEIVAGKLVGKLNNQDVIYKSVSSIRSIVDAMATNCRNYCLEPVLLQKKYDGLNLRVHVVEYEVFVSAITSNRLDYRYANGSYHTSWSLPRKVIMDCILIAKHLGLSLCGIDLIYFNNSYYILEVNPMPGFSYFCQVSSQANIYPALVRLLSGGRIEC